MRQEDGGDERRGEEGEREEREEREEGRGERDG